MAGDVLFEFQNIRTVLDCHTKDVIENQDQFWNLSNPLFTDNLISEIINNHVTMTIQGSLHYLSLSHLVSGVKMSLSISLML